VHASEKRRQRNVDAVGDQFRFAGTITTVAGDRAEKRIYDVFSATDCDRK
jgi:hypothetical protein